MSTMTTMGRKARAAKKPAQTSLLKVKESETTKTPAQFLASKTVYSPWTATRSFSDVIKNKSDISSSLNNPTLSKKCTSVKVNDSSLKFSSNYASDLKTLIESIQHLSINNQNIIVLQFVSDRQNHIEYIKSLQNKV